MLAALTRAANAKPATCSPRYKSALVDFGPLGVAVASSRVCADADERYSRSTMDNRELTTPPPRTAPVSTDGMIGIGITVAALGVLCLLLGWAQWMRLEHQIAVIFLAIGAVLVAVGAVTTMTGHARRRR